jgi:hypothetical protein
MQTNEYEQLPPQVVQEIRKNGDDEVKNVFFVKKIFLDSLLRKDPSIAPGAKFTSEPTACG